MQGATALTVKQTVADCHDLYYEDMERVPDNLPELIQFIALLRNAAKILNANPVPPTVLIHGIECTGIHYDFDLEDVRLKKKENSRLAENSGNEARSLRSRIKKPEANALQETLLGEISTESKTLVHEQSINEIEMDSIQELTNVVEGDESTPSSTYGNETTVSTTIHAEQSGSQELATRDEDNIASIGHSIDRKRGSSLGTDDQEPHAKRRKVEQLKEVDSENEAMATENNQEGISMQLAGRRGRRLKSREKLQDKHREFLDKVIHALVRRASRDDWI